MVREILREEKTLSQIASEYGTHANVISRWRDQALAALPGAFNDQAATDQAAKEAAWEKERDTVLTCVSHAYGSFCGRDHGQHSSEKRTYYLTQKRARTSGSEEESRKKCSLKAVSEDKKSMQGLKKDAMRSYHH